MKDELTEEQTAAILKALDDALAQGPWEDSNFLKVIGKNLKDIRDNFSRQINAPEQERAKRSILYAGQKALRSDQQEIYIALYSTEGTNIQSWERILVNLPRQMISRPIYANEEDIRSIIRTKENKNNEAYVVMYVNKIDILMLAADKIPVDKLGKPLLTLKDKSLNLDNVVRFVHLANIYHYRHGRLIKNSSMETQN